MRSIYNKTQVDTTEVQPSIAAALQRWIPRYAGVGTIVEFGCGIGRNLRFLREIGIKNPLVGIDFSEASIAIARSHVDETYARFYCCDLTQPLQPFDKDVSVVFSVHSFEMMPRVFPAALANIAKLQPHAAVFIEPISELWPWWAWEARLRIRKLDRLRGFYKPASKLGRVVEARCFDEPYSWVNPSCLMVVETLYEDGNAKLPGNLVKRLRTSLTHEWPELIEEAANRIEQLEREQV